MKKLTILCLLLGLSIILGTKSVFAISIGFNPGSPVSVNLGDAVSVDVFVSDLDSEIVSAFDLDVTYDDTLLSATNVNFNLELGDPLLLEAFTNFDIGSPGLIDFWETSLLSDIELANIQGDTVNLATLEFVATGTGNAELSFVWGQLDDVKGANNRQILPVPEPGTIALLLAGLFAVGFGKRKR